MNKKKKYICYISLAILLLIIIFLNKNFLIEAFSNVSQSFNRTLVEEQRYILILNGLKATIILSFFSILCGTMLGFLLFLIRRSKIKILSMLSRFLVSLLQGTPVTVLLLIFYYVFFGTTNINPIIVAIITFSIYFSAYISEIFRGAYSSISKTQIYSAYALGFTKFQTLKFIILPQILSYMIPVFKNESVSLIKLTSIAGYISIMDLTKASDIIRNRTYEAFFPLIFTAAIYFILCTIMGKLLDIAYKKINPRKVHDV